MHTVIQSETLNFYHTGHKENKIYFCRLGGVMGRVLDIGPKFQRVQIRPGDRFLRVIKVHSTPSIGGKVMTWVPCWNTWRYVKQHLQVWTDERRKANYSFLSPISPACYKITVLIGLPETSGGRVRSFLLSTSAFQHGSPCSYIT
jgi:hypothetical protein